MTYRSPTCSVLRVVDTKLVCLANSARTAARCVAGVTPEDKWIRPLGGGDAGAVLQRECLLDTGLEPRLLDLIIIPLEAPKPNTYQPENWTIEKTQWKFAGHLDDAAAVALLSRLSSNDPVLFRNTSDRVAQRELEANPSSASLLVIEPTDLAFHYRSNPWNRRIRAEFAQIGQHYDLGMTDPVFKERLGNHPDDVRIRADALVPAARFFLTVSLGEPWQGDCFKMVAGVIVLPK